MTRSLAKELAPRQIRVNAVAPGIVRTEMAERMFARLNAEQVAQLEAAHPLGFGTPRASASVAFLGSDEAGWITGHVLVVDGGFSVSGREHFEPQLVGFVLHIPGRDRVLHGSDPPRGMGRRGRRSRCRREHRPGLRRGVQQRRNAETTRIGDKAHVGPGVHIEAGVVIGAESRLEAGSFWRRGHTRLGAEVGPHCIVMGHCRIDDYVHLYAEVHVCEFAVLQAHAQLMPGVKLLNDPCPPTTLKLEGPVVGKCAVIGVNSIIWSGVHVGEHAVVASTSVVKNNVPDYMLVRGSPARPICDTRRIQMKLDGRWVYPYPWVRHFVEGEEITMPWGSPDKSSAL